MIIELAPGHCAVTDADDCTRLHVATGLATIQETGAALRDAGIGRIDDDGTHALIDLGRLRALAGAAATRPDWGARWDAMVAYATGKGWVSADGRCVRAHIETAG